MSGGTSPGTPTMAAPKIVPQAARIRIDKWLLLRFSVCFLILSAFEVTVIVFEWTRYTGSEDLASRSAPDYTESSATSSVTSFIPGVTSGLLAFLVFGTTGPFRKIYAENLRTCTQRRRKRPSFEERTPVSLEHGWRALEGALAGPQPSYSCTVRGGNAVDSIELTVPSVGREEQVKKEVTVVQQQERDSSNWPLGSSWGWEKRLSQSWRK